MNNSKTKTKKQYRTEDFLKPYMGNKLLKRVDQKISFTKEQVEEYVKCKKDIVYFAEKYMKIVHVDKGLIPFDMWIFQRQMLRHFMRHRFCITLASRQIGKSIITVAFILHYILFNDYKNVGILANKGATARQIHARLRLAYQNLPLWLQQGVVEWNKGSLELENGCRVIAASTSSDSIRGESLSLVFVDEAAFVPNWEDFYKSTFPTISSGQETRVILVSTANGMNHFHKLWHDAINKKNNYAPFKVMWDKVPGRGRLWEKATRANMTEADFLQEFCCHFCGNSNTLISPSIIEEMVARDPKFKRDNINIYYPPQDDHVYVAVVDVSRGKGLDYSVVNIIDATKFPLRVACVFRDNTISTLLLPNVINKLAKEIGRAHV